MNVLRLSTFVGFVFVAIMVASSDVAHAQSKLVQNMDTNKDGKVSRDEIPEGIVRRMFDNIVEKYKLDAKKTYTISELEQVMGLGVSGSSSSGPAATPNSPSRFGSPRKGGPFRIGPPSRSPSDGRPFRALEELPDPYRSYDKDGDGQIGLYEWPRDRIRDFVALDVNDDGFLTIDELKKSSPNGGNEPPKEKKEEPKSPADEEST